MFEVAAAKDEMFRQHNYREYAGPVTNDACIWSINEQQILICEIIVLTQNVDKGVIEVGRANDSHGNEATDAGSVLDQAPKLFLV